ncbi:MAG: ribosome silencing factor [Candidatus Gastranaerophilales bacterium]|nr:ribosome silencing factor [Candidatus Gastranaerophilales bacterium]
MTEEVSSKKLSSIIARVLDDKKATDIAVLNVANVCVLSDFFVIASASSTTQVKGLTSSLRERIKELFGRIPNGDENDLKNRWNLLDYGDVIVHIMLNDVRESYALEKFWNHALKVSKEEWEEESKEFSVYSK